MRPLRPSLLVLFLLISSETVLAQDLAEDQPQDTADGSPSLALSTDQSAPWQRFALTMNIVAPIWGEYALSLHAMPSRFVGVRVSGGFRTGDNERTFISDVSLDLRPFGRSFDGLLVTLGLTYEQGAERFFGTDAEIGYAFTWRSLLFEAAAGVRWNPRDEWAPRARLAVGLAF